jgi:hypothetical protein
MRMAVAAYAKAFVCSACCSTIAVRVVGEKVAANPWVSKVSRDVPTLVQAMISIARRYESWCRFKSFTILSQQVFSLRL